LLDTVRLGKLEARHSSLLEEIHLWPRESTRIGLRSCALARRTRGASTVSKWPSWSLSRVWVSWRGAFTPKLWLSCRACPAPRLAGRAGIAVRLRFNRSARNAPVHGSLNDEMVSVGNGTMSMVVGDCGGSLFAFKVERSAARLPRPKEPCTFGSRAGVSHESGSRGEARSR
jgi:hypothetical protein